MAAALAGWLGAQCANSATAAGAGIAAPTAARDAHDGSITADTSCSAAAAHDAVLVWLTDSAPEAAAEPLSEASFAAPCAAPAGGRRRCGLDIRRPLAAAKAAGADSSLPSYESGASLAGMLDGAAAPGFASAHPSPNNGGELGAPASARAAWGGPAGAAEPAGGAPAALSLQTVAASSGNSQRASIGAGSPAGSKRAWRCCSERLRGRCSEDAPRGCPPAQQQPSSQAAVQHLMCRTSLQRSLSGDAPPAPISPTARE